MSDRLLETVRRTITRHSMIGSRDSVLVAVSGGADSVALLAALVELDPGGWRLAAGHVDHRLRGRDSERDRRFVERLGKRLGVPVLTVDGAVRRGANLEERAREVRYRALHVMARRGTYRRIATAHTFDDQAETVLDHVIRGSGIGGLGGIEPVRRDGVIRPLLDVSRAEVERFLAGRSLPFRRDRTNASLRFTRNRIRHGLLPLLERDFHPRVRQALGRLAELARDDENLLASIAARRLGSLADASGLDAAALARLPPALRRRVVRAWLARERGDVRGVTLDHVDRVCALACKGRDGQRESVPRGAVGRVAGKLRWRIPLPPRSAAFRRLLAVGATLLVGGWQIDCRSVAKAPTPGPWRAVFDADGLDENRLGVRTPKPGDRIRPLGLGGTKKLQDVFVDAKVPRDDRRSWPVFHAREVVLWVPGLSRSEIATVTAATRRSVVIEARRAPRAGSRA
ncbi:MAG: tRNA lysidine(34) synthetase TilS [Candidatus Binatia bacterium]